MNSLPSSTFKAVSAKADDRTTIESFEGATLEGFIEVDPEVTPVALESHEIKVLINAIKPPKDTISYEIEAILAAPIKNPPPPIDSQLPDCDTDDTVPGIFATTVPEAKNQKKTPQFKKISKKEIGNATTDVRLKITLSFVPLHLRKKTIEEFSNKYISDWEQYGVKVITTEHISPHNPSEIIITGTKEEILELLEKTHLSGIIIERQLTEDEVSAESKKSGDTPPGFLKDIYLSPAQQSYEGDY